MEKRTLLAVVISLAVLLLYQEFILPLFVPPVTPPSGIQAPGSVVDQAKEGKTVSDAVSGQASPEAVEDVDRYLDDQAGEEEEIRVETELISAVISTRGATIKSWRLKKFQETLDDKTPLELVSQQSRQKGYYPLRLQYDDSALTKRVNRGIYSADRKEIFIAPGQGKQSLSLSYRDPEGLIITKTLTFYPDNYLIDITILQDNFLGSVKNSVYFLCWGYGLGDQENSGYATTGPTSLIDGELITDSLDDIKGQLIHKGNISWTGTQTSYFAVMFVPAAITSSASVFKTTEGLLTVGASASEGQLKPGEKVTGTFSLYIGPKQAEFLAKVRKNLENIIDYGWFHMIAQPLMDVLRFFHNYVKNWGLAIILLTIIIKLLFYPLTNSSYKSMQGMQKIQPKVNAIREKHKKDPKRMNTEIMDLYKKNKVNPLGGCLPMILQIPVFFGLYKALLVSIELRHSHSMLFWWINDLSAKDPYYIAPLIMGVTMFIQQKMTPSTGDPKQQKLMMFMPVIMTFMFLNFPSGLVIYWLVNNVLTIAQQALINRQKEG